MNYKPHIRKTESVSDADIYHCSLQRTSKGYWHTYGETMRVAYEKMMARVATHEGVHRHEPPVVEQHL
jgi:hypothetical protein